MFHKIPKEKQERIVAIATKEFADHHFDQASLNQIIESSGISKGGFFKYFDSKQDLYLFLVRYHLQAVTNFQKKQLVFDDDEIIDRIRKLAVVTIAFYQQHPHVYKMLLNATMDRSLSICQSVMDVRNQVVAENRMDFLVGIKWDQYCISQEDLIKVYNWFNLGLNATIQADTPIEQLIKDYELILTCLKFGVMKGDRV